MNFLRSMSKRLSETSMLNIFLLIHTIFGKYSINSDSKVISLLTALYCVFIGVILVHYYLYYGKSLKSLFRNFIFTLPELLLHIILYLCGKNKKYITFYSEIKNIDARIGMPEIPLSTTLWKYFLLRAITFGFLKIVSVFSLIRSVANYFLNIFVLTSNELTCAHRILIMYILNDRVKLLKEKFIKDLKDSLDIGQNSTAIKITKITENLGIYDKLIDAFDDLNIHLQLSILTSMLANALKMFFNLLVVMLYFNDNDSYSYKIHLSVHFTNIALYFVSICELVVPLDCAVQHLEELKLLFSKEILHCKDSVLAAEIRHARVCVNARPVQLRLARCVGVDASLPVSMLSFYISYAVVFAQLMNLKVF